MTAKRAGLLLLGFVLIGSAAALFARPQVEVYVTSNAYCGNCHGEPAKHIGGHDAVSCRSCHQSPQGAPYALLVGGLRGDVGEHGALDGESCKSCHEQDARKWTALLRTTGHATHVGGPNAPACATCHGPSLHEQPAAEERCEACHADTVSKSQSSEELDCTRCHVFGSRGDRSRSAPKPGTAVWGSAMTGARVHGAADCLLCHNPHREGGDKDLVDRVDCTSCHRAELARSVTHAPKDHQACGTCHRPHGLRTELATSCAMCHEKPRVRGEEHDAGVPDAKHELSTIQPLLAEREALQSAPAPTGVTHEAKCATCHTPHSWAPDEDSCTGCHEHEEKAKQLATLPKDSHTCLGCHEPHSPAPGDETCTQCHAAKAQSLKNAVPDKHRDCLSCHESHEGKPQAFKACAAQCHEEQATKLEGGEAKHRDCVNCHKPHDDPKQGAKLACKTCHEEQAAKFGDSKHETCSGCHSEHDFDTEAATAACAGCHKEAVAKGAAHQDECSKCHSVHELGLGEAALCGGCHEDISPKVKKHDQCNECHEPHVPASAVSAQCGDCHKEQAAAARSWPAESPHAGANCAKCHTKHDEGSQKACSACHEKQATAEHKGVHKDCIDCHKPHAAVPKGPTSWWGGCASCHKKEGEAAATGNPKHQLCKSCHDNPGRKPTECLTCHKDIRKQGDHQHEKHDKCTSCHATHGTTPPARKPCLSCHTDRRNHFPDAPKCQSCHPFTKE